MDRMDTMEVDGLVVETVEDIVVEVMVEVEEEEEEMAEGVK